MEKNNNIILEMKDITKTFLGGKIVANDKVSFKIGRGEVVSLVGENGSGKSTLMNILFGMYKQDSGEIYYEGEKVDMYASGASAKHGIGMVHQHFHLVDKFTVLDNILIGQEKVNMENEVIRKKKSLKVMLQLQLKEMEAALSHKDREGFKTIKNLDKKITQARYKITTLKAKKNAKSNNEEFQLKIDERVKDIKKQIKKWRLEIETIHAIPAVASVNFKFIEIEKLKNFIATAKTEVFGYLKKGAAVKRFNTIKEKYGIELNWDQRIIDLSVGQRQKVEIMKVLWENKNIIVFDEPTATLSVEEIKDFIKLVKKLQEIGVSIIFISHKLAEVKELADSVSILNKGKFMGSYKNDKTLTIQKIAKLMVGADIKLKFPDRKLSTKKALEIKDISFRDKTLNKNKLKKVSFDVREGEVFGLAGIEGNGQEEIIQILSGLMTPDSGSILLRGNNLLEETVAERNKHVSHIPTDRFKHGVVGAASLEFNSYISSMHETKFLSIKDMDNHRLSKLKKFGINPNIMLDKSNIAEHTAKIIKRLNVEGAYSHTIPIKDLSGGNQQKFVVGRELEKEHDLMIAGHPTRGLDIKAINNIYTNIIDDAKDKATVLFSLEITELLAVCDRLAIFHEGEIIEIIKPSDKAAVQRLPQLMVGHK